MWAIKSRSDSPLNSPPGRREWFGGIKYDPTLPANRAGPLLFATRAAARRFIKEKFGYIRTRPDLKKPPHCWYVPQAVRVTVTVTEKDHGKRPHTLSQSYA